MKKFNLTEAQGQNPSDSKTDLLHMEIGRLIDVVEYLKEEDPTKVSEIEEMDMEIYRLFNIVDYLEATETNVK
jgi:hypothetical protein